MYCTVQNIKCNMHGNICQIPTHGTLHTTRWRYLKTLNYFIFYLKSDIHLLYPPCSMLLRTLDPKNIPQTRPAIKGIVFTPGGSLGGLKVTFANLTVQTVLRQTVIPLLKDSITVTGPLNFSPITALVWHMKFFMQRARRLFINHRARS